MLMICICTYLVFVVEDQCHCGTTSIPCDAVLSPSQTSTNLIESLRYTRVSWFALPGAYTRSRTLRNYSNTSVAYLPFKIRAQTSSMSSVLLGSRSRWMISRSFCFTPAAILLEPHVKNYTRINAIRAFVSGMMDGVSRNLENVQLHRP